MGKIETMLKMQGDFWMDHFHKSPESYCQRLSPPELYISVDILQY